MSKIPNVKYVVHGSFTINIANEFSDNSPHVIQLINEITYASSINAFGYVLHLGKQKKSDTNVAINNMYLCLLYVYQKVKNHNIKILIETSSGQGSELCFKLNDYCDFFNKLLVIDKNMFRLCIDTCHIYQAGYDVTTEYFKELHRKVGLEYVSLIHLNDSKYEIGEHKDRHENIGHGKIGRKKIIDVCKLFVKNNIPVILETPDKKLNFIID